MGGGGGTGTGGIDVQPFGVRINSPPQPPIENTEKARPQDQRAAERKTPTDAMVDGPGPIQSDRICRTGI